MPFRGLWLLMSSPLPGPPSPLPIGDEGTDKADRQADQRHMIAPGPREAVQTGAPAAAVFNIAEAEIAVSPLQQASSVNETPRDGTSAEKSLVGVSNLPAPHQGLRGICLAPTLGTLLLCLNSPEASLRPIRLQTMRAVLQRVRAAAVEGAWL